MGCSAMGRTKDPAKVIRGPLASRNHHPVALTFLHPLPRRAATTSPGHWEVTAQGGYTSIFEVESAPGERVNFDGEVARASMRFRRGLSDRTDVEFELAAVFASSGFLDQIIDSFHDLFGLPDQGRSSAEQDQYSMRMRRGGQRLYRLDEDELGLGDLPVILTHRVRDEGDGGPAVAVRMGVELPTGSQKMGYGNGGLDYGVGAILERSLGRWTFTGGIDWTQNAQPRSWERADVAAKDMAHVQSGVEYRWNDRVSLVGQLYWTSPMTRDFEVEEFSREILDLSLGLAWGSADGPRWFAAFQEDLVAATGPDFGLLGGVTWSF